MSAIDLRLGRYQDVLQDIECDAVLADPPYSERTQAGHDHAVRMSRGFVGQHAMESNDGRRAISYSHWTPDDVEVFVSAWAPRVSGWFACMSDHVLVDAYTEAYKRVGLTVFQPLPCVIPGMTVRLCGDGPSSWAVYLNVARPKSLARWGTLPGAYISTRQDERGHIGGKPLNLMQSIVRDYSRPGDLICDPCAGGATTLLAAAIEGRRAVGSEMDPATFAKAQKRIAKGWTPNMFAGDRAPAAVQEDMFGKGER